MFHTAIVVGQYLIEFWSFTFTSSSSRCSIGEFNASLNVMLITVTLKTKMDQDASEWKTEGSVLTDVGSTESKGFDS